MHEPLPPYPADSAANPSARRRPAPLVQDPIPVLNGKQGEIERPRSYGGETELFDCGMLFRLRRRDSGMRDKYRSTMMCAGIVAVIGWAPLVALAVFQSLVSGEPGATTFFSDFAVTARSLIAAPLFVLAEWLSLPRLTGIASHFRTAGLVSSADDARFDAAWNSTLRLRDSMAADVVLIALAYATVAALMSAVPLSLYPQWHLAPSRDAYSPAGWWHVLVSLPILLVLLLTWLWRLVLWGRFLFRMSRLDLRLVPAHPDRTAGLRFAGYSVQAFSLVALALGAVVAGATANRILTTGAQPESFWMTPVALVAVLIAIFEGPLLVFCSHLLRAWRRGTLQYSALAGSLGRQFEKKWLRPGAVVDEDVLGVPDFSATTDLYQVTSNVYEVRLVPLSVASLGILVGMALIPFLVLALMLIPIDVIVDDFAKLLL
jgi:hypothetical protein